MDVLALLDQLDDLVQNAKPVPLSDTVRVDREEIFELIDQIRATVPDELKEARWIVKQQQETLAEVKREAERVLADARERAARTVSGDEITRQAERQAAEIVSEARREASLLRQEIEEWADGILATLEANLGTFLSAVRRGRERLDERSQETVVAGIGHRGIPVEDAPPRRAAA
jgi:cell division septum initiation protein DivIVA